MHSLHRNNYQEASKFLLVYMTISMHNIDVSRYKSWLWCKRCEYIPVMTKFGIFCLYGGQALGANLVLFFWSLLILLETTPTTYTLLDCHIDSMDQMQPSCMGAELLLCFLKICVSVCGTWQKCKCFCRFVSSSCAVWEQHHTLYHSVFICVVIWEMEDLMFVNVVSHLDPEEILLDMNI